MTIKWFRADTGDQARLAPVYSPAIPKRSRRKVAVKEGKSSGITLQATTFPHLVRWNITVCCVPAKSWENPGLSQECKIVPVLMSDNE